MSQVAIEVENLGKQYRLGSRRGGYTTLRESLVASVRGVHSRMFAANAARRTGHVDHVDFWALKDVSFTVHAGEVVGVVGRNGAGKSTLLKVLSRISEPTCGRAVVHGRVTTLLEVGTGFHSELTGRENVYLSGSVLGMSRVDIARRYDEIVAFADVERFMDTPVKHYSSGMYLRLAFSVAAHLEPDVLFVDEVLAVGDAEFQRRCLGRLNSAAKSGRTVLLVSHNLSAVRQLCARSIWLDGGRILADGPTDETLNAYVGASKETGHSVDLTGSNHAYGQADVTVLSFSLNNPRYAAFVSAWDEALSLTIRLRANRDLDRVGIGVGCNTLEGLPVFTVRSVDQDSAGLTLTGGRTYEIRCSIDHNLRAGRYTLLVGVFSGAHNFYFNPSVTQLEISEIGRGAYPAASIGLINCNATWNS